MIDRERLKQRNREAGELATRYPDKVADAALDSDELHAILNEWPKMETLPDWKMDETVPAFFRRADVVIAQRQKAEYDQTPEWRVSMVWSLLLKWDVLKRHPCEVIERWLPEYAAIDSDDVAQNLISYLAELPDRSQENTGISLLTDLVENMPVPVEWDDRRYSNLASPLVNTRNLVSARTQNDGQGLLFEDDSIRHVPPPPASEPRFEVGYLPGLEPPLSKLVPCALLTLWNPASEHGHGPVPMLCRVGWAPLLAVPSDARTNDNVSLQIELGKLASLVNPRTVKMRGDVPVGYKPSQHGPPLVKALRELNDPASGGDVVGHSGKDTARRMIVLVQDFPATYDADAVVSFVVRLPPGSKQGAQVDSVLLRHLASLSARQWRAMVTAYCLWDRYATVKGRLIDPTVPAKVRTNAAGYSIDLHGRVLADRSGHPTRSTTHPKAVQIGTERMQRSNFDRYYPWLSGDDLYLICHPIVASTLERRRTQRHYTKKTLNDMHKAGYLNFHTKYRKVRGGSELVAVRLLPTDDHRQVHAARWAANKHAR